MTKKDYELIASALKDARQAATEEEGYGVALAVAAISSAIANTHPRFDRARFVKATQA